MVAIVTLLACAAAYLIGSIPVGLLFVEGRSRNPPEIALTRPDVLAWVHPLGWKLGSLVLLGELAQGLLPPLCGHVVLGLEPVFVAPVALCALVGHLFSPYQKLRGGAGILPLVGMSLLFRPWAALIGLAIFAAVLLRWGRVQLGSVAGVTAICISLAALPGEAAYRLLAPVLLGLVLYRQRHTLLRLFISDDDPTPPELAEQTLLMSRPPDEAMTERRSDTTADTVSETMTETLRDDRRNPR